MSFPTKPFDITLPTNGGTSWALLGSSRSGKTTLLKYIYKTYYSKHISVMFSMNAQADIYKDLPSNIMVSDRFHPEIIKECHQINTIAGNKYPFWICSDDFVDLKIKNHPEILRMLTIYRNANISSVQSFQGRTLMSAVGRNSCNYICILKQNTTDEWINCIKQFLGMYLPPGMTMPQMVAFCQEATKDYQFFLIDALEGKCFLTKLTRAQAGV